MTWELPPAELKTFRRNPLQAVICELRFAPILKVHDDVPDFQERVRARFPGYQESEGILLELAGGVPRPRNVRQHRFLAKGDLAVATLSDTSVSLEYRQHREREILLKDAELIYGALVGAYRSLSPTRLGLRYVNVIDLETIHAELRPSVAWDQVVTPEFLRVPSGLSNLATSRFASEITSALPPGEMTVRMGLLPRTDGVGLHYRLDVDRFVVEDFVFADVRSLLASFVEDIYLVFRAAAGDALLEWMDAP